MQMIDGRSIARTAARAIGWLALGLMLLAGAWVLSNLKDIDPVPRPDALALPAAELADDVNAAFALAGLHAGVDREPAAVGRALWRLRLPDPAAAHKPLNAQEAKAQRQAESKALGETQPALPSLLCDLSQAGCVEQWIAQADALASLRQPHATFGSRCEKLLASRFEFEEPLPPTLSAVGPLAVHAHSASQCSQWLLSGAVLAWGRRDRTQSMVLFEQADRLNRSLLAGSRTLLGQMIALRQTRNTVNTLAAVAVRDPGMATALAALLAPGLDPALAARRWMVTEAAFQRSLLADAWRACRSPMDVMGEDLLSGWESLEGKLGLFACRHNIGLHPERTLAALDERWLHKLAALDRGLHAAVLQLAAESRSANEAGMVGMLAWRNPVGHLQVSIGEPAYAGYLARQADLELHREAALLALQAAPIAPPERAAWASRQSLSPLAQGRLSWDAEGRTLSARTWQQEYAGGAGFNAERDAIRITFPKP